jgi:hypothetical protein
VAASAQGNRRNALGSSRHPSIPTSIVGFSARHVGFVEFSGEKRAFLRSVRRAVASRRLSESTAKWTPLGLQNGGVGVTLAVSVWGIWSGCRDLNPGPLAPQARNIRYLQATLIENKRLAGSPFGRQSDAKAVRGRFGFQQDSLTAGEEERSIHRMDPTAGTSLGRRLEHPFSSRHGTARIHQPGRNRNLADLVGSDDSTCPLNAQRPHCRLVTDQPLSLTEELHRRRNENP